VAKTGVAGGTIAPVPMLLAPLPPPIPHFVTPWEELSLRRESEARPYRDIYALTGKRKRKREAHPSWADGGVGLPLISSKMLESVQSGLRMGLLKVDAERLVAAGVGRVHGFGQDGGKAKKWSSKRRCFQAGIQVGVTRKEENELDEVDPGVLQYIDSIPSSQGSSRSQRTAVADEDWDADSAYESEVDEWEVEVAHTIWLRSQSQSSPGTPSQPLPYRPDKALAVPMSSNTTLLQVPLSEAERCAWNEEARQQRKLRLMDEAGSAASQTQRDPESTLPVDGSGTSFGTGKGSGDFNSASAGENVDDLEATLAIASQQMLYELTGGKKTS